MKILEFFGEPLSYGGQETFIINTYKNLSNKNKYVFCTPFHTDNKELINLTTERGDIVLSNGYKFESKYRKVYIVRTAKKIVSSEYDIIHIHSGSVLTLLVVSFIAKKRGVKKIIVHSHATGYMTLTHRIIKIVSDLFIGKNADVFLACSIEAARYKFPMEAINGERFYVIKNGIELNKFKYSENIRNIKRKEFGLKDNKVLCHVGRFSEEKNHIFIIEVFLEYLKLQPNAILLLIGGSGPKEDYIKQIVKEKNIVDKVVMLKNRTDICEILCAADMFIFPSLFEGLGISAIEAQASGLYTLCADHLPEELNVSTCYGKLSLKEGPKEWAKKLYLAPTVERNDIIQQLKQSGYDIVDSSSALEKIYLGE